MIRREMGLQTYVSQVRWERM